MNTRLDDHVILRQYHLQPSHIVNDGKVKKIYTNEGVFVLKEIKSQKSLQAVKQAYRFYGPHIVPIYAARNGAPFVAEAGRYYYLMPWISGEEKREENRFLSFFRDLAWLHRQTLQEVPINQEEVKKYYEAQKQEWEKQRSFLQAYAEQCEKEWYMSPFQLHFCTYFHETMQAYWFAETQLETWYERIKEQKKWRISFIHGKPALSHYIPNHHQGKRYFLSWERARWASPLADVWLSLQDYVRIAPPMDESWIQGFSEYEGQLMIQEEERAFFMSHAAPPSHFYRLISRYGEQKQEKSEYDSVVQLHREYWRMKQIEYIMMRLVQINEKKGEEQTLNPLEPESDRQQDEDRQ
ncbi:spore coat protein YsxE [Anoxybacillus rupiensis]|uniref:Spore coat protein YsxE n=1 Tax=Anoxybacteroides rupiense TaxID=311460 RepID=A0ABD5IRZ5_9BACL|nr:spore coat protein YsxE [Anoxybacillus rupiensis]